MPGDAPVVSSSGITDWHSEAKVKGPGVVTGRYGTLGKVYFIRGDFWPLNTALYVRDFKGNDPRFVSYFLRGLNFAAYSDKAAVPGLNRNHLHEAMVRYPTDIEEQRTIAHILGTLDDKIELNRRMNQTLEGIARALFKSWFVDFDPVRAKMNGRWHPNESFPGLPAHLYDLFPDKMIDSELGEMPEGWEVQTLGDVADIIKGQSYKSTDLTESNTALVTLKSFARRGGYRTDGLKPYAGPHKPEQEILPGEIVVACTDVTQAAEVVGRPAIVPASPFYRTLVASLDVLIIRPTIKYMATFLYLLMRDGRFTSYTYAHTTGTTVLHLSKGAIPSFKFLRPPPSLLQFFGTITETTFSRALMIQQEIFHLTTQRNVLLPKLISGDVWVKARCAV